MPSWSDHFLPVALRGDADALRRARLTVQLSAVLIGAGVAYALFYGLVVGFVAGAMIVGTGAGVAAVALASLRVRPWLRAVGHLLTSVLYLALVALACVEGGLASPATSWLIMPPIFAILLHGRREAAAWTALAGLTVVGLFVAEVHGVRFPATYPEAWATRIWLGSYSGLVLCSAILLFVFEDIRAEAQRRAERASAELARLAYHDALTGLANRTRFLECLEAALDRAQRAGDPGRVAVLLLDLDGFKAVNDTLGHSAGDRLLAEVAGRLLSATRGCDTVSRLGGDEFAVMLDGVRQDADASVVARRIIEAIAAPFELDGRRLRIGASLGLARAAAASAAAPGGAAAAVLHHADVAMYRAKAQGRGRWVWYEDDAPAMPAPSAGRAERARPCLGVA